jgi:hypothetical protein
MPDPMTFDPAKASAPLYAWWLDAIPAFLGKAAASKDDAAPSGDASQAPPPIAQVSRALESTQQTLATLYTNVLRAMATDPPIKALDAFQHVIHGRLDALSDLIARTGKTLSAQQDLVALASQWAQTPLAMFGQALAPLSLNLERAYGGLADAFGLAPTRDLQRAARDLAAASLARRQAQAEYLAIVGSALTAGAEQLTAKLGEMAGRGESVDSLLALVRLWARTTDEAMHAAMQSSKALEASARLVRAAARARREKQRVVAIVSQALNVPTRAEVDDAYREIQELKRELRHLRKAVAPLGAEAALNTKDTPSRPGAADPVAARKAASPRKASVKSTRGTSRKAAIA